MSEAQVNRTERGTIMLSREEKRDVQLVAAFDNETESDTLRAYSIGQISTRAEQIRSGAGAAA